MDKPTKEQIKEFWEWCGVKQDSDRSWRDANGLGVLISTVQPDLDLNSLFKFAMPKLPKDYDIYLSRHWEKPGIYSCCIQNIIRKGFRPIFVEDEDPALALFWVIQEVTHG